MRKGGGIHIRFFIGNSLLVNGVLIFGAGVYQWLYPPSVKVVLFQLHAGLWWGAFLAIVGAVYCFHYWPGNSRG